MCAPTRSAVWRQTGRSRRSSFWIRSSALGRGLAHRNSNPRMRSPDQDRPRSVSRFAVATPATRQPPSHEWFQPGVRPELAGSCSRAGKTRQRCCSTDGFTATAVTVQVDLELIGFGSAGLNLRAVEARVHVLCRRPHPAQRLVGWLPTTSPQARRRHQPCAWVQLGAGRFNELQRIRSTVDVRRSLTQACHGRKQADRAPRGPQSLISATAESRACLFLRS